MEPLTSSTTVIDQTLQTRVLEYCRTHAHEFNQELNGYIRRYLLRSRMTVLVAAVLFISGPLMALKTGEWIFAFTHLFSCILFFAYGAIAKKFDYFSRNSAAYCDILCIVATVESLWVFFQFFDDSKISLIAGSSPTLIMIMIWALNTHGSHIRNLVQALVNSIAVLAFIAFYDMQYLMVNAGAMAVGAALGAVMRSLVFRLFRYQFYFSEQEKNLRNHAYRQLEKMLYPHQRRMIEDGYTLEETMPVGWGDACVIAFDVIESSKIKSPYARTLLQNVLKKCQALMMENYSQSHFEANAYRIKEMGDGFLCSVGFPFKTPGTLSRESLAIKLAQQFVAIFHEEAAKLAPNEKVYCAIGIASGVIEAFYPHTNPKEYDLYGRPLVLATRYESIRKELFQHIAKSSIIILQESVHIRLPSQTQQTFQNFELANFRIRDDQDAKRLFYQVFDHNGHGYARPPNIITHLVS